VHQYIIGGDCCATISSVDYDSTVCEPQRSKVAKNVSWSLNIIREHDHAEEWHYSLGNGAVHVAVRLLLLYVHNASVTHTHEALNIVDAAYERVCRKEKRARRSNRRCFRGGCACLCDA
jgi:hypothetical protein